MFAASVFSGNRTAIWIRWLLVLSGGLALARLSGVALNDMQFRNIGIAGYVGGINQLSGPSPEVTALSYRPAMHVYVLFAHPDTDSFNGSLAEAYCSAVTANGHELRRQDLFGLDFDPILRLGLRAVQPMETDLISARANLDWCERLVVFYPVWWGNVPALLKGFFDRTLYSEITYHHDVEDPSWSKMLEGRSAHIITTSDAPDAWLRIHNRDSDINAVRRGTLEFCGMKPVKVTRVGGVRDLPPKEREKWIEKIGRQGAAL